MRAALCSTGWYEGLSGFLSNVRAQVVADSWTSVDPIYLAGEVFPDPVACTRIKSVTLGSFELHTSTDAATAGSVVGTATGSLGFLETDEMQTGVFTAVLSAVPDTAPPELAGPWFASWNPLAPVVLNVSEPLWPGATLTLQCQMLSRVLGTPTGRSNVFSSNVTLTPGDTCALVIQNLVDLAGNAAAGSLPLLSSRIAGQRSLRLFGGAQGVGRFTARLAVPSGATAVRATLVEAASPYGRSTVEVDIGFPGYPSLSLHPLPSLTIPEGAQVWPLPEGVGQEVLFQISTSGCEFPGPGEIILDDLRVE